MKKFFLSFVGCLFIVTAYAQNPVYTPTKERQQIFHLEGGISYIKLYENQLQAATGNEAPAREEDFTILSEGHTYLDFTPAELQKITANRHKNYYVKAIVGRKIILIVPQN